MRLSTLNLIKCGYFPENIPQKIFSSIELSNFLKSKPEEVQKLEAQLKSIGVKHTPCSLLSSYKNDFDRRIMALPHIETYLILCNEIEKHGSLIECKFEFNDHSDSNTIDPYEIQDYEIRSSYRKNYVDRLKYSLGYKYMLNVDLSKCYENIYTHSLTWAMMGKENAKAEYKKKFRDQSEEYKRYDELDKRLKMINNDETKGIPTGPLTSRVISEIILMEIDNEISKIYPRFKRYVDDYNFYFRSENDAEMFLPKLQMILYEYKLHINNEKTTIQKYPYSINHNLTQELGKFDFKNNSVLDYIDRFNELYTLGNKGAMKFGLKVLKSKTIAEEEKEVVFSHLINLMITYPYLAEYVYAIFEANEFHFKEETKEVLNEILSVSISRSHDVEVIWVVTVMMHFQINIDHESIVAIINTSEVFSTILILDYVFKYNLSNKPEIKASLEELKRKLKRELIYGDKWLLIYEINRNDWMTGLRGILNKSKFLQTLLLNEVRLYYSPLLLS